MWMQGWVAGAVGAGACRSRSRCRVPQELTLVLQHPYNVGSQAWRHLQAAQQQRQQAVLAARRRIDLGALRRCLHAWRQQCGRHEWRQVALRRAQAALRRSLLARCLHEWHRLCKLRWWKVQVEGRDQQIQLLGVQLRHLESRPVRYMARFRLRAQLAAWKQQAAYQRTKQAMGQVAEQHARRTALCAALGGWLVGAAEAAARQRALKRARRLLARLHLRLVLSAWLEASAAEFAWRQRVAAAKQLRRRQLERRAVRGWRYVAWFCRTGREAAEQRQLGTAGAALEAWSRQVALVVAREAMLAELRQAAAVRLAARCLQGWLAFVEGRRGRRQEEELRR